MRVTVSWRGGAYLDPKGKEGTAALFGSQLAQGGTAKLEAAKLEDRLEALAATLTSSCTDTSCSVSLQVLDKDLAEGLDLLMQALTEPAFAQDRLDLAKRQARQRVSRRNDDVTSIATYQMSYLLFGEGHFASAGDTAASLEAITRDDLAGLPRAAAAPGQPVRGRLRPVRPQDDGRRPQPDRGRDQGRARRRGSARPSPLPPSRAPPGST